MDELDDDLKRRISEVFENLNEPSADEGWLLLRQKYPEKEKNRGIIWLWTGIAAAVLLLLGIGMYLFNDHKQTAQPQIAVKPHQQLHTPKPDGDQGAIREDSNRQSLAGVRNYGIDTIHKNSGQVAASHADLHQNKAANSQYMAAKTANKAPGRKPAGNGTMANGNIPGGRVNNPTTTVQPNQTFADNNTATGKQAAKAPGNQADKPADNKVDDVPDDSKQTPVIAMTKPDEAKPVADNGNTPDKSKNPADDDGQKKPKPSIFDQPDKANAMAYKATDKKPAGKAVRFGIYATTYFNYAKGADNQVNIGAGISSDIRLTGRLKLSTGLAVTQNSLNYSYQQAIPMAAADAAPKALSYAASANIGNFFSLASIPTFKNYNASMVNLDVPINLKYDIGTGKHDVFVSAGVSSGTFLNETYIYNYNTPGLFTADAAASRSQTNSQNFSNFYLARVLNMSFGVGFPLGHGNHLSVEPFVKYPLQGLGADQIKFGSGGVNLKFNFSFIRK